MATPQQGQSPWSSPYSASVDYGRVLLFSHSSADEEAKRSEEFQGSSRKVTEL